MERSTNMTNLFNYDNYKALTDAMAAAKAAGSEDALDDLKYLESAMQSFYNYVHTVDMTETNVQLCAVLYEGDDFRSRVEAADRSRRIAHEAAISNVNWLNNISCKGYNTGIIFSGDSSDRLQVADFCLDVTAKVFTERRI